MLTRPEDWTPEEIAATRARILADVSEAALERGRRARTHMAAWGRPKRCETRPSQVGIMGECLFCGADNGETCKG